MGLYFTAFNLLVSKLLIKPQLQFDGKQLSVNYLHIYPTTFIYIKFNPGQIS